MSNKIWIIAIGLLAVFAVAYFAFSGSGTGQVIDGGEIIKIPLSAVSTKAEFYDEGGIEYFVVKAKDGSVKTAFNACDVCYKSKKGYRQQGDDMICNNCGNYYAISGLGTKNLKGGGCWPGYLPSNLDGDYLVIKKSDIAKGAYRF